MISRPFILLALAAVLVTTPRAHSAVVSRNPPEHYLIVVDMSSPMSAFGDSVVKTVYHLLESGLYNQFKEGDSVAIWTFNNDVQKTNFAVLNWTGQLHHMVALQTAAKLQKQPFSKTRRLDRVVAEVNRAIKAVDPLTVLLVSDGAEVIVGTPFDRSLNLFYGRNHDVYKEARRPFVTTLVARHGEYVAWSVNAGGNELILPKPPAPPPALAVKPAGEPIPAAPKPVRPTSTATLEVTKVASNSPISPPANSSPSTPASDATLIPKTNSNPEPKVASISNPPPSSQSGTAPKTASPPVIQPEIEAAKPAEAPKPDPQRIQPETPSGETSQATAQAKPVTPTSNPASISPPAAVANQSPAPPSGAGAGEIKTAAKTSASPSLPTSAPAPTPALPTAIAKVPEPELLARPVEVIQVGPNPPERVADVTPVSDQSATTPPPIDTEGSSLASKAAPLPPAVVGTFSSRWDLFAVGVVFLATGAWLGALLARRRPLPQPSLISRSLDSNQPK